MKRTIFLVPMLSVLFILQSFTATPSAQVIEGHFENDITETVVGCNGVSIDVSGHESVDTRGVLNNNRINISVHLRSNYIGVDAEGNTYIGKESEIGSDNSPAPNGASSSTFQHKIRFKSEGSAPDFYYKETLKVTVNAKGETTVERLSTSTSCD